ncbi:unnamed protein product [Toxocara canis]|uniref:Ig-like domain-containing protein n=1 Tax=Toxocara canis TaxID=6265 RepID=A0A183UF99_TOXCA|nr:unnamed protein product [Toxocara canis]
MPGAVSHESPPSGSTVVYGQPDYKIEMRSGERDYADEGFDSGAHRPKIHWRPDGRRIRSSQKTRPRGKIQCVAYTATVPAFAADCFWD